MSGAECRFTHIEVDGRQVPVRVRGPRGVEITDADRQAVADFAALLPKRPTVEGER